MPELLNPRTAYLLVLLAIFALPWLLWRLARTDDVAPLPVVIIFATILLDKGVISADAFTALLLMAVTSTVLTIPMVRGRVPAAAVSAERG